MARRFIVEGNPEGRFTIAEKEARHIFVLRHKVGDVIQVNNKLCEIIAMQKDEVICDVVGEAEIRGVPDTKITLFQALLKADKMEFVIQKAVELGVTSVVPFVSKNVVVKLEGKDKAKKSERWNKISVEASKQCGRSDIVPVSEILSFEEMLTTFQEYDLVLFAYENEKESLKEVLQGRGKGKRIAVVIGAEGGFDATEAERVMKAGENVKSVSLGDRILRAETASLFLLSVLMYECEE
ncbi:MAG: 16S rRNA (uracil(1498)-N(3))-methyltransferase [Clostridia bacterium]|nr:16S rRNA (uracil(1498)-N(3))-methyltransferase [Clostridia bacterium]